MNVNKWLRWLPLIWVCHGLAGKPFASLKQDLLAQPLRNAEILPVFEATEPLGEAVLTKTRETGRRAVILIHRKVPGEEPLTMPLRSVEPVSPVLNRTRSLQPAQDMENLHLPSLAEGDILLLD